LGAALIVVGISGTLVATLKTVDPVSRAGLSAVILRTAALFAQTVRLHIL
jgi:hypothetical protein